MHPKFDATWLLVRSADSHWGKKGKPAAVLGACCLWYHGQLPHFFSTGECLTLWVVFSVHRRAEQSKSKQSFFIPLHSCIQTRGLPHMLFFPLWAFCLYLPDPPPNTHTPSISVCGLNVIEAWVIQETYSASSLQKPDLARLNHRYL